jgi:hypothetical protein
MKFIAVDECSKCPFLKKKRSYNKYECLLSQLPSNYIELDKYDLDSIHKDCRLSSFDDIIFHYAKQLGYPEMISAIVAKKL